MTGVQTCALPILTGVCETDFSGYPDCRDDTMKAMQVALSLGMDRRLRIETPLMWIDKAQTWQLAHDLGVAVADISDAIRLLVSGTAPITKASGKKKAMLSRHARNKHLADAAQQWAFSSMRGSPGAKAYYQQIRARGKRHQSREEHDCRGLKHDAPLSRFARA